MTRAEKEVRNQKIVQMRHDGKSMSEIAKVFGLSDGAIHSICKRYGVDGVMSDRTVVNLRNQYTNGTFDREANAIRYINERTPWFEYAGSFTGLDGYVDLRCKTCGTITHKSFVCVKHAKAQCDVCRQNELLAEKQRRKIRKREERKSIRFWSQDFSQAFMKICPTCSSVFIGSRKYCSDKCQRDNRWRMKDGYRYLFPLEDVYERDNGICYLCGGQCDWNDYTEQDGVIIYGNMYPSRDHVVPKSRGGSNSWENIRLAHRICNSLKSDSPSVEKLA